jgi:hypothetical protein
MKLIMEAWKNFLNEQGVKYSGILKIIPNNIIKSEAEALQAMLPEEAIRLSPKDFHVTLIHQSILSAFREEIRNIEFPSPPPIVLDDTVFERTTLGKKSWAIRLVNQDEMRDYVGQVMELLGSQNTDPEPERVFHISLANLTGHPQDSVR